MKKLILLLVTSLVVLSGCGGAESPNTTGDLPPIRPAATVEGTAFDGLVINGEVRIFDWNSGNKGSLLAETVTDGKGLYSVDIQSSDGPILIEVSGGYYIEESSGIQVQLRRDKNYKLMAVINYRSGVPVTVSATFFTTVAAGYAEYLVSQGVSPINAVINANEEISQWAGFDITRTTPLDVTDPSNISPFLTDELRYGYVAAAISEFTKQIHLNLNLPPHSNWPSVAVIDLAYEDVKADGVLNGKGENGRILAFGNYTLDIDTFRYTVADYLLRFVSNNSRNATSLGFNDVKEFAFSLNKYNSSVFDYISSTDISQIAPTVEQFLPAEGNIVSGTFQVSAIVNDNFGISSVEYYVDGQFVATAPTPNNPIQNIDSWNFSNGSHVIEIRVTNYFGNTTSVKNTITIANNSPAITLNKTLYTGTGLSGRGVSCYYSLSVTDDVFTISDVNYTVYNTDTNNTHAHSSTYGSYSSSYTVNNSSFSTDLFGLSFDPDSNLNGAFAVDLVITATNNAGLVETFDKIITADCRVI